VAVAATMWVQIGAKVDNFNKGMRSASKTLTDVSKSMGATGKSLTMGVTLPLLAIGAAAFKASSEMNAAMADVATLIPGNTERVLELKASVQDLAIVTGKSTKDIAAGLYQVVSAFGDSADTAVILGINARAAAAGLASTQDSINLTSAVTKAYGDTSAAAVQKVADLAFQTVKLGQTTFPELSSSIGRVTPLAATLGIEVEELFGGFATLTGVTGKAAEVSTQMAAILRAMMKPTEGMTEAIRILGYENSKAMLSELGMVGSLEQLITTTDGTTESVAELFGRAEALTAVFALTGAQADTFQMKLDAMYHSAGAMSEAFAEVTEGVNKAGFQWEQFKVIAVVLAQKLGDALAPMLVKVMDKLIQVVGWIERGVDWFMNLDDSTQGIIVTFVGLVMAIGPIMIVISKVILLVKGLLVVFAALTSTVGLVVAAIAALAAIAYLVIDNWDAVRVYFGALWDYMKFGFEAVKDGIDLVMSNLQLLVAASLDKTLGNALDFVSGLLQTFSKIPGIGEQFDKALAGVDKFRSGLSAFVDVSAKAVYTAKKNLKESATAAVHAHDIMTSAGSSMIGDMGETISRTFDDIKSVFSQTVDVTEEAEESAENYAMQLTETANSLEDYAESAEVATESVIDLDKAQEEAEARLKEYIKGLDSFGSAVIRSLKNKYEALQDSESDYYDFVIENQKNLRDQELQLIDDRLSAQLEALDSGASAEMADLKQQISNIDAMTDAEEAALKQQAYEKEISDLKKQVSEAQTAEARLKIQEELNQAIADHERELLLQTREIYIQSLRAKMDAVREELQIEKDRVTEQSNLKAEEYKTEQANLLQSLEDEKAARLSHFDDLLTEESLQAEARRLIISQNNDDIIDLLKTYNPLWQNAGQSFGEQLLLGLNSQKQSITSAVGTLLSLVAQGAQGTATASTQSADVDNILGAMMANSKAWWTASEAEQSSLHQQNVGLSTVLQSQYGMTPNYDSDTGKWDVLSYKTGGIVPGGPSQAVPIIAHGGEEIVPYGQSSGTHVSLTYIQKAPVYGILDFEQKVKKVFTETARGGGFRGVLQNG